MCPVCLAAIVVAGATSGGGIWALKRMIQEEAGMKTNSTEVQHKVGTREEWLTARLKLLKAEKEHTRRGDELGVDAAGVAVGSDQQGVSIRDRRGDSLAIGPLSRAFAAPDLPLHVRTRLRRRLSILLGDRRWLQWIPSPPGEPRRDALGCVARSARQTPRV